MSKFTQSLAMTRQLSASLCLLFALAGCASVGNHAQSSDYSVTEAEAKGHSQAAGRMLIYRASLQLLVDDTHAASDKAKQITLHVDGYIESMRNDGERYAYLTLRVPAAELDTALSRLSGLGKEKHRRISSTDVTESYIDLQAKLENAIALRDRLRGVLDRASKIEDILAIEQQLSRVQTEIDAMEGRLKNLRGQVQMAHIDLTLERKRVLGPLGYLAKGVGWVVQKLFVIK